MTLAECNFFRFIWQVSGLSQASHTIRVIYVSHHDGTIYDNFFRNHVRHTDFYRAAKKGEEKQIAAIFSVIFFGAKKFLTDPV